MIENQNTEFKRIWKSEIFFPCRIHRKLGLPEPFYKEMGAGFALVFEQEKGVADFSYALEEVETTQETTHIKRDKTSGKTSNEIIEIIKRNKEITIPELANKIGVTERSIERNIENLKHKGLLKRIGPAKGGHWQIPA